MELEAIKFITAAAALFPMVAVAMSLGRIFSSYNESVGRNPSAAEFLDKKYFIALAVTEALGIFSLLVSLLILFS